MSEPLQRTDAWRQDRAGKLTASCFKDIMDYSEPEPGEIWKSGPRKGQLKQPVSSAARDKKMLSLAFERTSRKPVHEIFGAALTWGTEVESYALSAFEVATGLVIQPASFVTHPDYPFIGSSADGFIGKDGGIECKCPHDEAVHIRTILEGMPEQHMAQVQGAMFVTGRKWWYFISYDPRAEEPFRLYYERVERDDEYIERLKNGLLKFEGELQDVVKRLEKRMGLL